MERKYEYTGETNGNLKRIRALKSFGDVKKGNLGGFIADDNSLSHTGDCWVYHEATVANKARVYEDAKVKNHSSLTDTSAACGKAVIEDNSWLRGDCWVSGYTKVRNYSRVGDGAKVFGDTVLEDYAMVMGYSVISGNTLIKSHATVTNAIIFNNPSDKGYDFQTIIQSSKDYFHCSPIGDQELCLTAYKTNDGYRIRFLSFVGTASEFIDFIHAASLETSTKKELMAINNSISIRFTGKELEGSIQGYYSSIEEIESGWSIETVCSPDSNLKVEGENVTLVEITNFISQDILNKNLNRLCTSPYFGRLLLSDLLDSLDPNCGKASYTLTKDKVTIQLRFPCDTYWDDIAADTQEVLYASYAGDIDPILEHSTNLYRSNPYDPLVGKTEKKDYGNCTYGYQEDLGSDVRRFYKETIRNCSPSPTGEKPSIKISATTCTNRNEIEGIKDALITTLGHIGGVKREY